MAKEYQTIDLSQIDQIMEQHRFEESALIGMLQDIQKQMNYLPEAALRHVAKRLDIPLSRIYGLATFYKAFSLEPRGRHLLHVCVGTACHVRGGKRIAETIEKELGIKAGQTTRDNKYTIETVRCVGCCGLAPVIIIDEDFHGNLTQSQVPKILKQYE